MGLVHRVPEGGTVREVPSARSAHARGGCFFASFLYFQTSKAEEKIMLFCLGHFGLLSRHWMVLFWVTGEDTLLLIGVKPSRGHGGFSRKYRNNTTFFSLSSITSTVRMRWEKKNCSWFCWKHFYHFVCEILCAYLEILLNVWFVFIRRFISRICRFKSVVGHATFRPFVHKE